jgi:aryl-alcohol dehydrogenase-like predicted oxidoreductase
MLGIGVSDIDTAGSSTSGRCETLIGAAFQGRLNDFVVVTKDFPHPAQYAYTQLIC